MEGAAANRSVEEKAERLRAARLSLFAGILICGGKFAAVAVTGSSAVLSDAMESIVNIAASALMLASIVVASQPADRNHPYGHGKAEFVSAGIEGTLIAIAGLVILAYASYELWVGPEVQRIGIGLWILGFVTLLNAALGTYLIRVGRRTRSLALEADGRHLMADVVTSVGVFLGLGAVMLTGWTILDPLVAIAVALHIFYVGWRLFREALGGLMDEADPALLQQVAEALEAQREPWHVDIHSLRVRRSGPEVQTDFHMAVPRFYDADQLHDIHDDMYCIVFGATGAAGEMIVHFDPCRPRQCDSCAMEECPRRSAPMVERHPLDLQWVTREDEVLETGEPMTGSGA